MPDDESDFIAIAVAHGLLQQNHAAKILDHAAEQNVQPSDAALSLSMLQANEVEAVNLLCHPRDFAPGYELTGLIGCGAGGIVFRALQTALDREVALKTINPRNQFAPRTSEPRIQREAHAIAKLRHPGIVAAFDSGFFNGRFCIAMELVEGENLVDFVARNQQVSEKVTWEITKQVAFALSHAADAGIIHRDIKPSNLLLCEPPKGMQVPPGVPFVKVADFGLATDDTSTNQITATGVTLGTPAFVAPEQLNDPKVDIRADIYSLGATVFQMLSGHPPCMGQSPMKTIMQKTIGDGRWRDEISSTASPSSTALFRDMTEADAEERIPDYETLIQRIDEVLDELNSETQPTADKSGVKHEGSKPEAEGSEAEISSSSANDTRVFEAQATLHDTNTKSPPPRSSRLIFAGVAVLAVAGLVAAGVYFRGGTPVAEDNSPPEVKAALPALSPDGFPQPLFNGASVPLFLKAGVWLPLNATDGSRVLAGESGAWMTIPMSIKENTDSPIRLRVSVNLVDGSEADIAIGCKASPQGQTSSADTKGTDMAIIHLSSKGVEFAPQDDRATQVHTSPIPLAGSSDDSAVFQNLVFIRHKETIFTLLNGEPFGQAQVDSSSDCVISLRSTKGTTHFADIDIIKLK